jgi:aryl-alcohol dehydrogenase-like predicted oxidoreductase
MVFKELGRTGCRIPAIGQGASHAGSYSNFDADAVRERIEAWRCGFDAGMTLIDTAELYGGGFSEELVGKALKGVRETVFLASKFNPRVGEAGKSVVHSVEKSLQRLQTDRIDLYQMHFPNPFIHMEEIGLAISRLIEAGKIRYFGCSNFSAEQLVEAGREMAIGIVSNQAEYNLADRSVERSILPLCVQRNMTLLAYSPLGQGRNEIPGEGLRLMEQLSVKYEKSIFQIVLRWLVAKPHVVALVKAADSRHVAENARAADFSMEEVDLKSIDSITEREHTFIPVESILVESLPGRHVYGSIDEALQNEDDLIPSPESIARQLTDGKNPRPIRLVRMRASNGKHQYKLDPYDILGQAKLYWAWVIAFGTDRSIPSFIDGEL